MAIIQLEAGLAPSSSPRCEDVFTQQQRFFDSLRGEMRCISPHSLSNYLPSVKSFSFISLRFLSEATQAGMDTAGRSSSSAQSIQSMPFMN